MPALLALAISSRHPDASAAWEIMFWVRTYFASQSEENRAALRQRDDLVKWGGQLSVWLVLTTTSCNDPYVADD